MPVPQGIFFPTINALSLILTLLWRIRRKLKAPHFMGNFKTLLLLLVLLWVFLTFLVHIKSNLNQKCLLWFFSAIFCACKTTSVCEDWPSLGKSYFIEKGMVLSLYLPKITMKFFHCNFSFSVKPGLNVLFWNADVYQATNSVAKARGKWMETECR